MQTALSCNAEAKTDYYGQPPKIIILVKRPPLLNPTSTEPGQMGSKHLLLIRLGVALLVQLRCFRISDKQGAAVKAFTTGTAFMAQSHLGLPKLPW